MDYMRVVLVARGMKTGRTVDTGGWAGVVPALIRIAFPSVRYAHHEVCLGRGRQGSPEVLGASSRWGKLRT